MATKVGPAAVSYGIGVQNRYSAFLDDDDGFATPASILANTKRLAEQLNKQKVANGAHQSSSKPHNQSSHSNNPSGGGKSGGAKSASSNKQSADAAKGVQHNNADSNKQRNEMSSKRGGQQRPAGQGANNFVQPRQQIGGGHQNGAPHARGHPNGAPANGRFTRAPQSNGPNNRMNGRPQHQQNSMNNKENNDGANQGKFIRQNNQRPIVKRSFNQDDRRGQASHDAEGAGATIGQSNEEEKRRRQQKRALDMKHKDPEKREAKRQQSDQAAQSNGDTPAVVGDAAPGNQGGPRNGRGRRQFQEGDRTDEAGRRGGNMRNRVRRTGEGNENGVERRENGTRGPPRADRPQRNRNGFGQGSRGSRGSRGDDQGKFGAEKQRPIPNFSDKSDFPSLAS